MKPSPRAGEPARARRVAAVAGLVGLTIAACAEEPRRHEPPLAPVPTVTVRPVVMECRLDPFSSATSGAQPAPSGLDVCFTAGDPEPWWVRYQRDAEPEPTIPDAGPPPACPTEMILVEGSYCPEVRHRCLRYLDDLDPNGFLPHHRCAEFDRTVECLAPREHRRFCIDRDEYVAPGGSLPLVDQSWTTTGELCESLGKRLCFESEWQFACEGEGLLPYPYGFVRNAKLCNHDLGDLSVRGKLRDQRVRPATRPLCVSPFGVRNMVGNVDEWTRRDGMGPPYRAALHGGWWLAGRNSCRAATTGHDEVYFGPQTGVRCCANAR